MAGKEVDERIWITPFTILIDSGEEIPFEFTGMRCQSDRKYRPIEVQKRVEYLGIAQGDYQLAEYRGLASIERKSLNDLYGTILGFDERRPRFERELATLDRMEMGAIVIESSFGEVLANPPDFGKKTPAEKRASLRGSYLRYTRQFRKVHWFFCDTRSLASLTCYRLLEMFWEDKQLEQKAMKKLGL